MSTSTGSRKSANTSKNAEARPTAVELLQADHRDVEALFTKLEKARTSASKRKIAEEVCRLLVFHAQLEEELFYPACEAAGLERIGEAKVEHEGLEFLIAQIVDAAPDDELWEAKVKVLKEQVEHHVAEEEGEDGVFAKAQAAKLDLEGLGEALAARQAELL